MPSPEESIRKTLAQYGQLYDDRMHDELAELFTEDAVYVTPTDTTLGREALRSRFADVLPTVHGRHLMVQAVIDVDGDTATVTSDLIFISLDGEGLPIEGVSRYHDRMVPVDGRWLFAERRIAPLRDLRSDASKRATAEAARAPRAGTTPTE
jgi:uncharacterized protein (TIGR02246 family)